MLETDTLHLIRLSQKRTPLYYIFLKEDDIDYIETVERESHGSYRIHLKREVEFLEGEPEKKIYLKSLTDMEVFPS